MKHGVMIAGGLALLASAGAQAAPLKKHAVRHAPARPAKADWTRTVVRTPEGGVRMGDPAAPVKLVEYGARTCPTCARFSVEGFPLLKAGFVARGQVSFEFRDFPVHGALDLGPILLGRCVPLAGFFPVLEAMMADQAALVGRQAEIPADKQAELTKATPNAVAAYLADFYGYTALVTKTGLPPARAKACLADGKGVSRIVAEAGFADKTYHIAGTPTFIVNGTVAERVADWAALEPVLRAAGAK